MICRGQAGRTLFRALGAVAMAAACARGQDGNGGAAALPDMLVTATRTARGAREVPASVTLIGRSDVELLSPIAVDELLRSVGGADLQGSGLPGSAIRFGLRGLTAGYQTERVLVLVDGRRVNEQYQGNAELALLPADNISRVEVLRGPASVLYGSGAMGGVVQLFTRTGADSPGTELRAAAGSHGTQQYRASHAGKLGAVDYRVNAGHVETLGYMDNTDGTDRDWRADNVGLSVGGPTPCGGNARFDTGYYAGQGTDEASERATARNHQAATYTRTWKAPAGPVDLRVMALRSAERHVYDWKYPGKGVYDQQTWGGDVQCGFWAGPRHHITAGAEVRQEEVDASEVLHRIDEQTTTSAGYVQDEIRVFGPVQLTVGIRGDFTEDYDEAFSPRIGLLYSPAACGEVYASFGQAHRAPSLSDRYVRVEYQGMLFEGNPDLDPETLTAYEVGGRWRLGERVSVDVALFDSYLEDAFDFMRDDDGVFRNRNVSRVRSYGAEVGAAFRFCEWASAYANYACTEGRYGASAANPAVKGNQVAYLARDKASAGLNLRGPAESRHSVAVRYAGPRYADAQNTRARRMKDYAVMDLRTRWPVARRTHLTLNVDNVFNTRYREFPDYEQPGTTFMAGVEQTF